MHKIILGQYPPQFIDFFARSHHRYSTSSSSVSPFIPTFHRLETTKRALSYRACKTWNSIPLDIKYKTISLPRNQDTNENHRRIIRPMHQFTKASILIRQRRLLFWFFDRYTNPHFCRYRQFFFTETLRIPI